MPTKPRNKLKIETLMDSGGKPTGARLFGFLGKTKIRKRGTDIEAMQALKAKLEDEYEQELLKIEAGRKFQHTWLSLDQIRDAEAAITRMPAGRTLVESAEAADLVLGNGEVVLLLAAKERWKADQERRNLEPSTIREGQSLLTRFFRTLPKSVKHVHEITDFQTRDFCFHDDVAAYTRVARASGLRNWFNFCVAEKIIKRVPIAFKIDELIKRAKPVKEPEILTPEECQNLLKAACDWGRPAGVVYTILATWCFMRKSEILRFQPEMLRRLQGDNRLWVHLKGKKQGSRWRDVPIPNFLLPLFEAAIKAGAFKDLEKKADGSVSQALAYTEEDWREIRASAGLIELAQGKCRPDKTRIIRTKWTKNVLRHTGMSYLFQETGDADLVTKRAGNSIEVAFLHYLRDAEPDSYVKFNAVTVEIPAFSTDHEVAPDLDRDEAVA